MWLRSAVRRHSNVCFCAAVAHALGGEREKALAAGCDEFDTKPIEFDRLVATIRRILAARTSQSDSRVVKVNERENSPQRYRYNSGRRVSH